MEVRSEVLDAITHAIRSVERRRDGLQPVAARHSAAAKAALDKMLSAAPAQPVARLIVTDRPGSR